MHLIHEIAQRIHENTGKPFTPKQQSRLGGGSINSALLFDDGERRFFVKTNRASLHEMFEAEAEGLSELQQSKAIRVPSVVGFGQSGNSCFLILEYIEFGRALADSSSLLGEQLANIHRITRSQFGWHRNNTIGSTPQINTQESNWSQFYRDHRLGYQLELAKANGARSTLLRNGENLLVRMNSFFDNYHPAASLVHGDLWSGNYDFDSNGQPVIFDPAVYFGDRETDIAMTELFGGFSNDFYAAYNNAYSLDAGYTVRKRLYNLYHVLNHFNLFGGGYQQQAEDMVNRLLAEAR